MTRLLATLCSIALLVAGPGLAQGISKGVGSFPVVEVPGTPGVVPVNPAPEPPAPGASVGLLASDPGAIQAAMLAEGYQAKLTTSSSSGNPMITGKISKSNYWVYFLDCKDNTNCKGIQFHCAYELSRPIDAAEMNDFNSRYRYVRAWLNDEGHPRMQMDLLMRDDGMGPMMFNTYLDLWRQLIGHWEDQLGI